jgi:DNA-binding response OmpR family regulator
MLAQASSRYSHLHSKSLFLILEPTALEGRPIVLVVEDEPLIGLSVEEWLKEAGYHVLLTESALEALHELESAAETLSALVTDIRLGGEEDGWQLARRARELNPLLPIVYASGDSAIDHSSQGVPHSIMVQKPFAAAQIVTAISTLINKVPPTVPTAENA